MIDFAAAKAYLDRGWSVIPVKLMLDQAGKVQKKPMIAWREYQERLPTEEELHLWFDSGAANGIGLVTGKISRLVVVDVDTSAEMYYSPMMVRTISGGTHAYYRWTEEMRNDAGIADKPIDFRGDGGFVVLPPSRLGNQAYAWLKEVDFMFLSPVPAELKAQLKLRKAVEPQAAAMNLLRDGLPRAAAGTRNNVAAQVAGMLCKGITRRLLPLVGFQTFVEWNRTHCDPPLDERELERTWQSIYAAQLRNHPDSEEQGKVRIFAGKDALDEYQRVQDGYGAGLSTGFTSLDTYFHFLPEQLYLLSSPTHQGKTTLSLNVAARVAASGEAVLFCSLEQGVFIAPRVESMLAGPFPQSLSLLVSDKMLTVEGLIEAVSSMTVKPRLMVVDHLHFIQKEGKGVTEDIDTMILSLQSMAKRLELPVLVIAHVRKLNADRPPELDDLRDSSSLSQVPSVVMLLYRKKAADVESMRMYKSYLEPTGILLIAKNRIQGKTGALSFQLKDSGEFFFT